MLLKKGMLLELIKELDAGIAKYNPGELAIVDDIEDDKIYIKMKDNNCIRGVFDMKELEEYFIIQLYELKSDKANNPNRIDATVTICVDVSGSAERILKYYQEIYEHYESIYANVKLIKYTTTASYIDSIEDFNEMVSGGTYMSSGLGLAFNTMVLNFNPNDAIVICGDGDNWSEDNDRFIKLMEIATQTYSVFYHEILAPAYTTPMSEKLQKAISNDNFEVHIISDNSQDIFGRAKKIKTVEIDFIDNSKYIEFKNNIYKLFNDEVEEIKTKGLSLSYIETILGKPILPRALECKICNFYKIQDKTINLQGDMYTGEFTIKIMKMEELKWS